MKITDLAAEKIKEHLKETPDKFLRIQAVPGGCSGMMYSMGIDDKSDGDIVEKINGVDVLMDPETKELMADCTIDYDEAEDGFKIDNPNASAGCHGCPGCH